MIEIINKLRRRQSSLPQEQREATTEELAAAMESTPERILEIQKLSIEDRTSVTPYQAAAHRMMSDRIDQALSTLTDREHKALRMRFGLDDGRSHTLEEVGKEEVGKQFGVIRERIRQIEAKALRGCLE